MARGKVVVAFLAVSLLAACAEEGPSPAPGAALRVVSLVPTATETIFALGAGDRLVGRSRYCDWPPEVVDLPALGDAASANAETILRLHPDLILFAPGPQAEALSALGGTVRLEPVLADSIEGVRETIRRIASLLDREEAGRELLARIDGALARARSASPAGARPRVLFVVQHEPLVVAGGGSYVGELLSAVGAENAAGELSRPWPTLSLESFVARDPSVILDAGVDPESGDESGFFDRFTTVAAVKEGRVISVHVPALVRPGPRLPEALGALRRLVFEERR